MKLSRIITLIIGISMMLAACTLPASPSTQNQATQNQADAFLDAIVAKDCEGAKKYVSPSKADKVDAICSQQLPGAVQPTVANVEEKPEDVARSYVEALLANDCQKAASLVVPDERGYQMKIWCSQFKLVSARIDQVVTRDFGPDSAVVSLVGQMQITGANTTTLKVTVEKLNGHWYINAMRPD